MDAGLLFVNTGKELILIYEPFFGKWVGFAAYDTNMPILTELVVDTVIWGSTPCHNGCK